MCLKIGEVISNKVTEVQSTFDVGDFKHPEKCKKEKIMDNTHQKQLISGCRPQRDKKTDSNEIYVDENGVYHYVIPHCSHCGSVRVTKHDTNETSIYSKDGTKVKVRVKKYNCESCGKGSQVEFKDEFKKYSGVPVELDSIIVKLNSLHWISLRDKSKIIKATLNISVSYEYVRKAQLITDKLFWKNEDVKNPKYVNYDVQWIPTDNDWSYLYMAVDRKTKDIIGIELTDNEKIETTEAFFDKIFKHKPEVIISDLKSGYRELIVNKMKIEHQGCLIHFRKALNKKIRKELNKIKNRIEGEILLKDPDISESDLETQIKEIMKPIQKRYWNYKDEVMEAFNKETFEESSSYIQNLRKKVEGYPSAICKYLKKYFFDIYRTLILYKHDDYKDKISPTNNLSESKIGWCASKSEKRKYRTDLGFFNHILARIINRGNI